MAMPQELQAARLRLVKDRPYLASAAWALQPRETPGLGTLAVDQYWRLYYDSTVTTRWTVEELSGVLYHEIMHLLRDHASRMKDLDPRLSNICSDAEINDNLLAERVPLPDTPVTPASIGQPENLLAEEYYAALESQARQSAPQQGASAQSGKQDSASTGAGEPKAGETQQGDGEANQDADSAQDTASASAPGGEAENGSTPSQTAAGGSQADDAQPGGRGDASGSKAGDFGGSKLGDGGEGESGSDANGSPGPSSSSQPPNSSAQSGASSQPPVSPGESRGSGQDGGKSGAGAQTPAPGAGRCGSCATGQQEPWEDGPPANGDGVSHAEGELIRRDVARQIKEASQSRGNVPGHWTRWAEEKLRSRIDWRKELAAAVRHAVADVSGASDYSYRRPSRRQGQVGNGKVVLPSLRHPVPEVAVVVDTSGSMSDGLLSQTLAEVSGVLKAAGLRQGVTVLAVDTQVQTAKRVFDARQVQLAGGGGTDMGRGLEAAAKLRPQPQVVIILTDGYTPLPPAPPRGVKVIVGLLGDGDAPGWAKKIKIEERR